MSSYANVEVCQRLLDEGFPHAFTTFGLDFATARGAEGIARELDALAERTGLPRGRCYLVSQVHGARVARAEGPPHAWASREADAIVAYEAGVAAGVRVADCVPVLVGDLGSGRAAAIHAGWRGVVAGVVPAALSDLGGSGVVAAIGPCIGACCFEVSEEVAESIAAASEPSVVIARYGEAKARVDLRRAVRAQLVAAGARDADVEDVGGCSRCATREGQPRYHSHRRDGASAGRMLAIVAARVPTGPIARV